VVISVPATTVDDELRQRGVAAPKLIKIDTEGVEQLVPQRVGPVCRVCLSGYY
jgi:hypothetical protein